MFENIKRLFVEENKLNIRGLENAVLKGWITNEQKEELILEKGELFCMTLNQ